jgi:hypothetical protein
MYVSMRRYGVVVLGTLALLGPLTTEAHGQRRPLVNPLNLGLSLNPFVNPFATIQQFPNVAVLGRALQNQALLNNPALFNTSLRQGLQNQVSVDQAILNNPALFASLGRGFQNRALRQQAFRNQAFLNNRAFLNLSAGLGYGSLLNSPAAGLGYGALLNSSAGLGSGALLGAAAYGGVGGYGGYGTQWMQNPYSGYLQGATSITNANANYQLTIQQAKLLRQDAIRSAIQTRRAWIEQAEYERAHMPDPEKIRQAELARELDHARNSPPLTEIWSARSLNTLLRSLIAQQGQGLRGPNVPLSEDTLKSINLTAGDTRGNVGLLKDNGNLQWPQPLRGELFKETREDLDRQMRLASRAVMVGNGMPDEGTVNDLDADWKKLNEMLDASVSTLSPDQYVEAKRYLKLVGSTITALKDRNVSNYFNGKWTAQGKNVAALVKYLGENGLSFAPSTPSDEPAYLALYYALAAFDAGMRSVAANTSGRGGSGGNEGGSDDK